MSASLHRAWPAAADIVMIPAALFALAVVELFHPHPRELMQLDVNVWLAVHYAQIPLFALAAIAIAALVRGLPGIAPMVCRIALFVFATSYIAFDTAAGVVIGIFVGAARASGDVNAWRMAIETIWTHPIVGSAPTLALPLLAVLGSTALSVGAAAAAVALRETGRSWPPLLLLVIASFGIAIFRTHAWPGGPLTFGGMGIAAAWLSWDARRG
ncbi:hypothetical protein AWB75_06392 [Caballeronia catudaia]|uniref:Uncharacterized protein n=1 Tax=Caballeronia catudaia TaxID=1777136 RepID=A0A158D9V1_9BURK|nr:hypothetical protein [Caballeronia catudaia]SAK90996.1 hypothetical protein AWB75_06392 [Caballeronia catudaia]